MSVRWLARAVLLAGMLQVTAVRAQAVDDATRGAARTLGYEGIAEFQAGRYAVAAEKLDRAYLALKVPSLGLWSARAFEKVGRLVAASERYLEVVRLDPSGGDLAVQREAQADAAREQAALESRIPTLVIVVEGADGDAFAVSVNGAPVPASLLGAKRPVDPGPVKVDVRAGDREKSEQISVTEGEQRTVTLTLVPKTPSVEAAKAPSESPTRPVPAPIAAKPASSPVADTGGGSTNTTLAMVAFGLGGAGLILGGVTGGMAASRIQDIDDRDVCRDNRCPPSMTDEVDEYNTLRTLSTVGFGVGLGASAVGVALLLTAPKAQTAAGTLRVAPWVAPGLTGFVGELRP
jgi:hypothetical protein